ncbi:MAG: hypothetical protein A2675_01010 [Candidatus Yonathbacteria bacterium RIFCSPHIGHO2_01_FULL_51_10]|uniref:Uncharacterized protein n=1 Tax=Candidatus Yonathbacteria bacterium RIFCSPHIGHO2_01_FULL_51_10 TaxID=1802723 RepID=A0A1G2S7A2_9BACT|nr:MAG: hypothetical protein A2675_01010 [Candidatus Yonathbacteria bacterium RIFCSPHIGHO2_01_FULL_51_10]
MLRAYAATNGGNALDTLIGKISQMIINPIIEFLMALAVIYFIWGILQFVRGYDTEEDRDNGRRHMLWSIVGFAIMVLVFAIINFVVSVLGIPDPY